MGSLCWDLFTASIGNNWDGCIMNALQEGIKGRCFMPWSPGWRGSKHFWKLIWGSGPKRLQFYFQMTGVLSLVTVIVSLLICHKTSVKSETSQVELELPLSGQIQLFSTFSLMGRDSGWETEYYNLQLIHSFLQSPIST